MCPDIERFAPLISAAFGLDTADDRAEHPGHRLRVRLADRSLRQLNPLLSVLSQVLDLADSRMTASSLLDLAAYPPVARKFGFTEDDTSRLASLVTQAGVRWGLDAPHRRPYGLEGFGQNTWAAGLDRMLLGVAMDADGDHFIGTALPLDDVDSSDVDLVGRLTELVVRIRRFVDVAAERRSLSEWASYGRTVIEGLTATTPADSWQVSHAYAQLSRLTDAAGDTARDAVGDIDETLLGLAEVRALLADSFRGRASRANFRTGTLTIATLHPMRSIPHRVVCLLGVDDGLFPRRSRPLGDDLLALDEWIGDPDPRSEDRQLLLDAIMAAEDHLVIIYGGADPRSGAERPPAVPIGELLDALDRTVSAPDDRPVREHLTTRHPLQPFEAEQLRSTQRTDGRSVSTATALRGALAAGQPQQPAPAAFGTGPLRPADIGDVIALPDLVRFFGHPARTLLRVRANLTVFSGDDGTAADQLPVALDGLERWEIGERLLQRHLQGGDLDQLAAAEWRRGSLPPRSFGDVALSEVLSAVREVADRCRPYRVGEPGGSRRGRRGRRRFPVRRRNRSADVRDGAAAGRLRPADRQAAPLVVAGAAGSQRRPAGPAVAGDHRRSRRHVGPRPARSGLGPAGARRSGRALPDRSAGAVAVRAEDVGRVRPGPLPRSFGGSLPSRDREGLEAGARPDLGALPRSGRGAGRR